MEYSVSVVSVSEESSRLGATKCLPFLYRVTNNAMMIINIIITTPIVIVEINPTISLGKLGCNTCLAVGGTVSVAEVVTNVEEEKEEEE